MSCELVPSVTLYGTTQITTTIPTVITSTIKVTGEPQIHLTTNPNGVPCPPGQTICQFGQTQLVTDTPIYDSTSLVTTQIVSVKTAVVPQKTLYYPCSSGGNEGARESEIVSSSNVGASSSGIKTTSSPTPVPNSSVPSTIPSSTKVVTSPSPTETDVAPVFSTKVASDSQVSTDALTPSSSGAVNGTTGQGNESASSQSGPNTPVIGGIVGGVVIVLLLLVLCLWCRRGRDGSRRSSRAPTDLWERRFRQLEAEGDVEEDDEKIVAEGNGVERVGSKKIRLTLDLASKDLPSASRPVSTLSAISSFFKARSPHALPFRASPTGPSAKPLNFSRPRFGQNSKRSSVGTSRSKSSHKTEGSVKSLSNWLSRSGPKASGTPPTNYQDLPRSILVDWDRPRDQDTQRHEEEPEYLERSYDPNDPSAPNPFHDIHAPSAYDYSPSLERSASDHSTGDKRGTKSRRLTPAAPSPSSKYTTSTEALTRSTMTSESFSLPMMSIPHRSTMGTMASHDILGGQPPPSSYNWTDKQLSKLSISSKASSRQSTQSDTTSISSEASISASRPATRDYTSPPDYTPHVQQRTLVGLSKLNNPPVPPVPPIPELAYLAAQDIETFDSAQASSAALAPRPPSSTNGPSRLPSTRKPVPPRPAPRLQLSREAITPSLWVDEDAYDRFRAGLETTSVHLSDDSLSSRHASSQGPIDYAPVREAMDGVDLAEAVRQVRFKASKETFGHASAPSIASRPESPRSVTGSVDSFMTATEGHGVTPNATGSRKLERSAVTPQLPPLNLEDGSTIHFGRGEEGEEKIMSMYDARND